MVVADLDSDGRYDILYGVDVDEAARTSLARPDKALAHVNTAAAPTNPASVTDLNTYDELPLDVQEDLKAIKSAFLGMLDAMLASKASAATVTGTDIPSANALYAGETEMGVVNRGHGKHPGQNDNYTPHMRPAEIRCEPCTKDAKEAYAKAAGDGKGVGGVDSCVRLGFISDPVSASDLTALQTCCGPLDCGYYGRQHQEEGQGGQDYLSDPNGGNALAEVDDVSKDQETDTRPAAKKRRAFGVLTSRTAAKNRMAKNSSVADNRASLRFVAFSKSQKTLTE